MLKQCMNGFLMLLVITLITGLGYPLAMTGLAKLLFPTQASGSLVEQDGKVIGSALIGQNFNQAEYFHGRQSAAGKEGYDAATSSGTNLGPTSKKLAEAMQAKIDEVRTENNLMAGTSIPADLVTASASGLDPDISPDAANIQVERVAQARGLDLNAVKSLVDKNTQNPQLGFLGCKRVNVLKLNIALDTMQGK